MYRSYTSANPYESALVVYEESDTVKEGYAYAPVPVELKVPAPEANYAFDLTGVYNATTNFGNTIAKSMHIDPKTGEILIGVAVLGVMCFMALGMVAMMSI